MIKLYGKNAKKHPDKQLKMIANSLKKFGWQQPIKVGKDNVIIAGHGRWMAFEKYPDGIKDAWIIDESGKTINGKAETRKLTVAEEKAYRIADNKIAEGDWKKELVMEELAEMPDDLKELTGFDLEELTHGDSFADPEVEFSDELLLEHNYVVLYFDNMLDWQVAVDKLGLKTVKSIAPDKSQKIGMGRVINGKDIISKL